MFTIMNVIYNLKTILKFFIFNKFNTSQLKFENIDENEDRYYLCNCNLCYNVRMIRYFLNRRLQIIDY